MASLNEEQTETFDAFLEMYKNLKIGQKKKILNELENDGEKKKKSNKSSTEKKGRQVPDEVAKDNQGKVCKGRDDLDYIPVQNKAGAWCWRKLDKTSNTSNTSEEEKKEEEEEVNTKPIKSNKPTKAAKAATVKDSSSEEENSASENDEN
jgi:hypothetical protein